VGRSVRRGQGGRVSRGVAGRRFRSPVHDGKPLGAPW
jgi:hypothetical protein